MTLSNEQIEMMNDVQTYLKFIETLDDNKSHYLSRLTEDDSIDISLNAAISANILNKNAYNFIMQYINLNNYNDVYCKSVHLHSKTFLRETSLIYDGQYLNDKDGYYSTSHNSYEKSIKVLFNIFSRNLELYENFAKKFISQLDEYVDDDLMDKLIINIYSDDKSRFLLTYDLNKDTLSDADITRFTNQILMREAIETNFMDKSMELSLLHYFDENGSQLEKDFYYKINQGSNINHIYTGPERVSSFNMNGDNVCLSEMCNDTSSGVAKICNIRPSQELAEDFLLYNKLNMENYDFVSQITKEDI